MLKDSALILVDLQNDFFPGGALGVPNADHIFPLANEIQSYFKHIIATKDWHPKNHASFITQHPEHQLYDVVNVEGLKQILWPEHCVQDSFGSDFHPQLKTDKLERIIYKGTDPRIDSYSTFYDNAHRKKTELDDYLKFKKIQIIYIMGLATDYCVLYSVLDACQLGYQTFVIADGCFGINKDSTDVKNSLELMKSVGAKIINSSEIKGN